MEKNKLFLFLFIFFSLFLLTIGGLLWVLKTY